MAKTHKVGRDSKTGEFIPVKEAERRPDTTTVERVPNPGYGDTDSGRRRASNFASGPRGAMRARRGFLPLQGSFHQFASRKNCLRCSGVNRRGTIDFA